MSEVRVTVAARSEPGRVHPSNEDAFIVANLGTEALIDAVSSSAAFPLPDSGLLFAVSDGMGGDQAGDLAASTVLESLRQQLVAEHWTPLEKRLELAVRRAHLAMRGAGSYDTQGLGAALTALVVIGEQAYLAGVGDSRAYVCRNGMLHRLTTAPAPIVPATGSSDDLCVAIGRLELRRLDTILVCCDGIWNSISDDELLRVLSWHGPRRAADRLIDVANERCREGNLTAVVAQFDGAGLEPASASESLSRTFTKG